MRYFKFPKWLKRFYPDAIWDFYFTAKPEDTDRHTKTLYLTFDDGPNPATTDWILNLLDKFKAKATFFCIGNNVLKHPNLFASLTAKGHQIGNHSHNHLNGFHTKTKAYISDIEQAALYIPSSLYRPPYGKMTTKQYKKLKKIGFTTVFWSHISYDFDPTFSSEQRLETALKMASDGGIVVFHDSDKAFPQLQNELPILLEKWTEMGFQFKSIQV